MSEMIERVATAIAEAAGSDFKNLPVKPGPGHGLRNMYLNMARAAIEAMKSADTPMINAGFSALESVGSDGIDCVICFNAMIGAALKD